jgi:hypothetical protein
MTTSPFGPPWGRAGFFVVPMTGLRFPKPTTRKAEKRARDLHARQDRADCRRLVIARQDGRCYVCRARWGSRLHVHEVKPRSLGGSPTDPDNCVGLCAEHHEMITHHDLDLVWYR